MQTNDYATVVFPLSGQAFVSGHFDRIFDMYRPSLPEGFVFTITRPQVPGGPCTVWTRPQDEELARTIASDLELAAL